MRTLDQLALADTWPSRWLETLRSARTAALWLASPAERWLRQIQGRGHLPPLWLRRHVGAVSHFESAARATAGWLDQLGLVKTGDVVLDVGCGCGAMVAELGRRLGSSGRYVGFDVHGPSIRWCQKHFLGEPRFRFELAELRSPYGDGMAEVSSYRFPLPDGAANLVLAKSVFTHLLEDEAAHYLREVARVLSAAGHAFISTFLFAEDNTSPPAFPYPRGTWAPVRWRLAARPTAAVAYELEAFKTMIQEAGLRLETMIQGFFPGETTELKGQDQLVLRRADAPDSRGQW